MAHVWTLLTVTSHLFTQQNVHIWSNNKQLISFIGGDLSLPYLLGVFVHNHSTLNHLRHHWPLHTNRVYLLVDCTASARPNAISSSLRSSSICRAACCGTISRTCTRPHCYRTSNASLMSSIDRRRSPPFHPVCKQQSITSNQPHKIKNCSNALLLTDPQPQSVRFVFPYRAQCSVNDIFLVNWNSDAANWCNVSS